MSLTRFNTARSQANRLWVLLLMLMLLMLIRLVLLVTWLVLVQRGKKRVDGRHGRHVVVGRLLLTLLLSVRRHGRGHVRLRRNRSVIDRVVVIVAGNHIRTGVLRVGGVVRRDGRRQKVADGRLVHEAVTTGAAGAAHQVLLVAERPTDADAHRSAFVGWGKVKEEAEKS